MIGGRWSLPLAAALIVAAGFMLLVRPLESALSERASALQDELQRFDRAGAVVREAPEVERETRRLAASLAPFQLQVARPVAVGRFLEAVAATAGRNALRLTAVAADPNAARAAAVRRALPRPGATASALPVLAGTARPAPSTAPSFDEIPLTVTIEGEYRSVIRALRELSRANVAAHVTIASLTAVPRPGASTPGVTAVLHVRVARENTDEPSVRVPVL